MPVGRAPICIEDQAEEGSPSILEGVSESECITESRNTEALFEIDEAGSFLRDILVGRVDRQRNTHTKCDVPTRPDAGIARSININHSDAGINNANRVSTEQSSGSEITGDSVDTLEINFGRVCKANRALTKKISVEQSTVGRKRKPDSCSNGQNEPPLKTKKQSQHLSICDGAGNEQAAYQCCGKSFLGATAFHNHLKSPFHIERVCRENKIFRCYFCNRYLKQDVHNWLRHLKENKVHKRHVISRGGEV